MHCFKPLISKRLGQNARRFRFFLRYDLKGQNLAKDFGRVVLFCLKH